VRDIGPGRVRLENGVELAAGIVVLAAGLWLRELARLPLIAKKGHLVSIEGPVGFCRHQIVEMGYVAGAHSEEESVSFNIQPRPGGELVVGSTRQPGVDTADVEERVVEKMLRRAIEFMPDLESFRISSEWTGLRAETPDGLPVIGAMPGLERVYVAGGHEGLGLTMATGTAEIIADLAMGRAPVIDAAPFSPARFERT
jgi:D-hydroxyproline dehydrogenase subunit beta